MVYGLIRSYLSNLCQKKFTKIFFRITENPKSDLRNFSDKINFQKFTYIFIKIKFGNGLQPGLHGHMWGQQVHAKELSLGTCAFSRQTFLVLVSKLPQEKLLDIVHDFVAAVARAPVSQAP